MSIIAKALKKAQEKRAVKSAEKPQISENGDFSVFPEARGTVSRAERPPYTALIVTGVVGIIILAGVTVASIFLLRSTGPSSGPAEPPAVKQAAPPPVRPAETAKAPETPPAEPGSAPAGTELSDPRTEYVPKPVVLHGERDLPSLNGIMYSPSKPQAIINGSIISEGGTTGAFTVKQILPDKVILQAEEKEYTLKVR